MPNTNFCETRGKALPVHGSADRHSTDGLRTIATHYQAHAITTTPNSEDGDISSTGSPEIFLITRHIPTAILATCRMVNAEADIIVKRLLKTFILEQEPKLIYDTCLKSDLIAEVLYAIDRMNRAIGRRNRGIRVG
jgi:hypothetical protein